MDISLPYNWIKDYVKSDYNVSDFAHGMSLGGPSIEKWNQIDESDDFMLDIEVTTNRVDMSSVVGLAREAGAILDLPFLYEQPNPEIKINTELPLDVRNEEYELCPVYNAIVMTGIELTNTPEWMKHRLEVCGMKSINLLVDISNYVLLEYGQPTHIFDYDKVGGKQIVIRKAKAGETIVSLDNDKEFELKDGMLVIADENDPIAIAGIKGGKSTGVSDSTTNIVIEAANFEQYNIRKTARALHLHTDASSLFEKGLNTESAQVGLKRVVQLVQELAGGEIASEIKSERNVEFKNTVIEFNTGLVKRILGIEIENSEIIHVLKKLEFEVIEKSENLLEVVVPYFRSEDIIQDYDLVEEIARIYGYHKIPNILPQGEIPTFKTPGNLEWEEKVKDIVANLGFNEAFGYAMVSDKHLEAAGLESSDVIELANPLTADYVYLKKELATSMIENVANNETYADQVKMFELNRVFIPVSENELPNEVSTLMIGVNGSDAKELFYSVKGVWEFILKEIGINPSEMVYSTDNISKPYKQGYSASISYGELELGYIGIADDNSRKIFDSEKQIGLVEINFDNLYQIIEKTVKSYTPIPKYPSTYRDYAFLLDSNVEWAEISEIVSSANADLIKEVEMIEAYVGQGIPAGKKSITLRVTLMSSDKTLEDEDIDPISESIVKLVSEQFRAEVR